MAVAISASMPYTFLLCGLSWSEFPHVCPTYHRARWRGCVRLSILKTVGQGFIPSKGITKAVPYTLQLAVSRCVHKSICQLHTRKHID